MIERGGGGGAEGWGGGGATLSVSLMFDVRMLYDFKKQDPIDLPIAI